MAQTDQLIDTLKRALKAHGKNYRDVAQGLDLSEASVKRLFSDKSFSLKRLEQVCQILDMEISDLVQLMSENSQAVTQLSEEQEAEIAGDIPLILVAICVLNRWTLDDLLEHYELTEPQCIRCLTRLDRLKLIDLLPGNRIKLRVSPNFRWRKNGPIQQFFQDQVHDEFFRSRFTADSDALIVTNGMLTKGSNALFQKKLHKLIKEFNELNDADAGLPVKERYGTTIVLAMRQWNAGLFSQFQKRR